MSPLHDSVVVLFGEVEVGPRTASRIPTQQLRSDAPGVARTLLATGRSDPMQPGGSLAWGAKCYCGLMMFKARVKAGRLVVDEPTDLPEGTEIELLPSILAIASTGTRQEPILGLVRVAADMNAWVGASRLLMRAANS